VIAIPDDEYSAKTPSLAGELVTSSHDHQLKVDTAAGTSSAILAALQPLGADESMVVQLIITPLGSHVPKQPRSWWPVATEPTNEPISKSVQDKYSGPLFSVSLRLGVSSPSRARDHQLLGRLTGAFHAANSPRHRCGGSEGQVPLLFDALPGGESSTVGQDAT